MLDAPGRSDVRLSVPEFRIAVHPHRSEVVVAPSGELDIATASEVAEQLESLREVGFVDIIVDLRGLTFIDSTGIQLLVAHTMAAKQSGARLRVVRGSGPARRAIELCCSTELLDCVDR